MRQCYCEYGGTLEARLGDLRGAVKVAIGDLRSDACSKLAWSALRILETAIEADTKALRMVRKQIEIEETADVDSKTT